MDIKASPEDLDRAGAGHAAPETGVDLSSPGSRTNDMGLPSSVRGKRPCRWPCRKTRFMTFRISAPAILLMEFALNKVITHLCNSHRQVGSLESIRVDFAQQPHNSFACRIRIGILAGRADHSLVIDAFPVGSPVRPTELPYIWTALPTTPE